MKIDDKQAYEGAISEFMRLFGAEALGHLVAGWPTEWGYPMRTLDTKAVKAALLRGEDALPGMFEPLSRTA